MTVVVIEPARGVSAVPAVGGGVIIITAHGGVAPTRSAFANDTRFPLVVHTQTAVSSAPSPAAASGIAHQVGPMVASMTNSSLSAAITRFGPRYVAVVGAGSA